MMKTYKCVECGKEEDTKNVSASSNWKALYFSRERFVCSYDCEITAIADYYQGMANAMHKKHSGLAGASYNDGYNDGMKKFTDIMNRHFVSYKCDLCDKEAMVSEGALPKGWNVFGPKESMLACSYKCASSLLEEFYKGVCASVSGQAMNDNSKSYTAGYVHGYKHILACVKRLFGEEEV